MQPINPLDRRQGEGRLQYLAFQSFIKMRKLPDAYREYMQENVGALTTELTFYNWASKFKWSARLRDIDIEEEIRVNGETRRLRLGNENTAEEVAKELFAVCLEGIEREKSEMNHRAIGKYLEVASKIVDGGRSIDQPQVIVNVDNSASASLDISDEVLKELGKKLVAEDGADSS